MTRQNRVLPTGEIVALPFRGGLMGNRGILHDETGRLGTARWRHKAWIACRLAFKGRHRPIMAPHRYTELFFLDEAVSFAAGHRPCAECRRGDFDRFREAWREAKGGAAPSAGDMDRALHAARVAGGRPARQARTEARLGDLPDGMFVLAEGRPALLWAGALHPYLLSGYGTASPAAPEARVEALTHEPSLAAFQNGNRPQAALSG